MMMTLRQQLTAISIHAHQLDLDRQAEIDEQRAILAERASRTVVTMEDRHAAKDSKLLAAMRGKGFVSVTVIAGAAGYGRTQAFLRLRDLESRNMVTRTGYQRSTKWAIVEKKK